MAEQLTLDSLLAPAHKVRGDGPIHAWDCMACMERSSMREADLLERNPFRPGTKSYERYRKQVFDDIPALDPRYEHYWSM